MTETLLESIDDGSARFVPRPFLYTKNTLSAKWTFQTDLIIESATLCAGAQDIDTLIFRRKYGLHILPDETEAEMIDPLEHAEGMWVKLDIEVVIEPEEGSEEDPKIELETIWVGQVAAVTPIPQGSSASGPYGEQVFTCYGGAEILRKTHLSKSFWLIGEPESENNGENGNENNSESPEENNTKKHAVCQWLPIPNDMWGRGVGNRSAEKFKLDEVSSFVFGGSKRWTCGDFAEYLIKRFVSTESLEWNIVGAGMLDSMDLRPEYCSGFSETASVWDLLHAVIRPDCGLDFYIRFQEVLPESESDEYKAWFDIVVFSLTSENITVGDTTFLKNPDTLKIVSGGGHDFLRLDLVKTEEYNYSKFRLYGDRILLCATLWGESVEIPKAPEEEDTEEESEEEEDPKEFRIVPLWKSETKKEYDDIKPPSEDEQEGESQENSAEEQDPTANDAERAHARFADVYTKYGAKKELDVAALEILPASNSKGKVSFPKLPPEEEPEPEPSPEPGEEPEEVPDVPDYQWIDRATENFVPLFADEEGPVDFQADPAEGQEPPDKDEIAKKEPSSPLVWFLAEDEESESEEEDDGKIYRLAHELGFSVTPLSDWLGVQVSAKPQHLIAGEWNGSETEIEPQWDYRFMVATLAFKTDQRVFLEYDTGDQGQILEEVHPKIQCWAIAPGTAVAYSGKKFKVQEEGVVVRNDIKDLEPILAAKAARYKARGKAVVELFALRSVNSWLGTILSKVKEDVIEHEVNAPITKITLTWRGENNATTTISAGYPS